jgi:hypothetical protein
MRLVYVKDWCHHKAGEEVKEGDVINLKSVGRCKVDYFAKPHKSSSEGKVTVKSGHGTHEFYVGVINAEWIEREDRLQGCGHPESAIVTHGLTSHCSLCNAEAKPR